MGFPNKQIGGSQESILLQQILKQLSYINGVVGATNTANQPTTTTTTTV